MMRIERKNYSVLLDEPTLYIDNQSRGRSGHMSHAMAEWKGSLIDFNSNCSAVREKGHSTFGWVEYRYSHDGGESFSEAQILPYSMQTLLDGVYNISLEKAVTCDDGSIVAFCLRNDSTRLCEPWATPTVIRSEDGGKTWCEPYEFSSYRGRVYDARYYRGKVYALEFCNDGEVHFCGNLPEHLYRIFVSEDNGKSFHELSVVDIPTEGRGYGSLLFDGEGKLHVYAYNLHDEVKMDHAVSEDGGKTWKKHEQCFVAKGIRNPQTALLDGVFLLHARGADMNGFILYTSTDGSHWDEGEVIAPIRALCYYSNNIILKKNGKNRLLIQYSECFNEYCVNVMHRFLEIEKH